MTGYFLKNSEKWKTGLNHATLEAITTCMMLNACKQEAKLMINDTIYPHCIVCCCFSYSTDALYGSSGAEQPSPCGIHASASEKGRRLGNRIAQTRSQSILRKSRQKQ